VVSVPVHDQEKFLAQLEDLIPRMVPRPKALIVNFPSNPTTECVELPFLARLVELARQYGFHLIQDLAYADIAFDGYKPPRSLKFPAPKKSPSSSSPFQELQHARLASRLHGRQPGPCLRSGPPQELFRLRHLHSHPGRVDSGIGGPQECVHEICENYRSRRNVLRRPQQSRMAGSVAQGHHVRLGQIPEQYRHLGSLEFSKLLLNEAKWPSPRNRLRRLWRQPRRFALIENEERTRQALRGIRAMLAKGLVPA